MDDQEETMPEKNTFDSEAGAGTDEGGDSHESDGGETETEKVAGTEPNEGAWNPADAEDDTAE